MYCDIPDEEPFPSDQSIVTSSDERNSMGANVNTHCNAYQINSSSRYLSFSSSRDETDQQQSRLLLSGPSSNGELDYHQGHNPRSSSFYGGIDYQQGFDPRASLSNRGIDYHHQGYNSRSSSSNEWIDYHQGYNSYSSSFSSNGGIDYHQGYNSSSSSSNEGIDFHLGYNSSTTSSDEGIDFHLGYNSSTTSSDEGIDYHQGYNRSHSSSNGGYNSQICYHENGFNSTTKCDCISSPVNQRQPPKSRNVTPKAELAKMSSKEKKDLSRKKNNKCQKEYIDRKKGKAKELRNNLNSLEVHNDNLIKKANTLNKKVNVLSSASYQQAEYFNDRLTDLVNLTIDEKSWSSVQRN